jgi:hypothetical protein
VYQIDLAPDMNYDADWIEVKKIQLLSVAFGSRYSLHFLEKEIEIC